MAWRLDEAVEHGLIDNTVAGTTTGKIWLVGRDEPLILSLNGDCWRDLAGMVLEFENPEPLADAEAITLDTEQTGIIGDMTASRKACIPTISDEEIDVYMRGGKGNPHQLAEHPLSRMVQRNQRTRPHRDHRISDERFRQPMEHG